ncbi:hypothetical protein BJ912DRAFT_1149079 [Pholiota molesta]|nr:hypothetical protein BJ912DRAFT_1149079 [Pholiota molesta]
MPSGQHHTMATTTASTTHHRTFGCFSPVDAPFLSGAFSRSKTMGLEGQIAKETGWDWLTGVQKSYASYKRRISSSPTTLNVNGVRALQTPSTPTRVIRSQRQAAVDEIDDDGPAAGSKDGVVSQLAYGMGMEEHTRRVRGCGTNILLPPTTTHSTPREASFGAGGRCQLPAPLTTNSRGIRVFEPPRSCATIDGTSQPEVRRRAWDVRGGRKRARYGARPRIRHVSPPQETLMVAARVALAQQGTYTPLATPGRLRPPIPALLDASLADEPALSWPLPICVDRPGRRRALREGRQ